LVVSFAKIADALSSIAESLRTFSNEKTATEIFAFLRKTKP